MSLKKIIMEGTEKTSTVTGQGIFIPLQVGDTILTGRFKNKKTKVKSIGVNEHGMPTINGKNVTRFRYAQPEEDESN